MPLAAYERSYSLTYVIGRANIGTESAPSSASSIPSWLAADDRYANNNLPELRPMSGRMINVAIVEDNRLVRDGLTLRLNEQPDVAVSYAAATGSIEDLRTSSSDVLLLDVGLEDEDSLNVAERVRTELPDMRVIVMDLLPVHEDLVEFVTTGVAGFILKDATLEELLTTIRSVAAGQTILPPQMTSTLFSQIVGEAVQRGVADVNEATGLTPREKNVVGLIGDGLSNKAIAKELGISPHTVKSHVRNVMDKLTLHSRLQIAAYLRKPNEASED